MHMEATQQTKTNLVPKGFWMVGLMVFLLGCFLLIGELAQYDLALGGATNSAVTEVRQQYPALVSAFTAWDDCQHGRGNYANGQKPVYYTIEQCDADVIKSSSSPMASIGLKAQADAIKKSGSQIYPAWPLSLFL